MAALAVSENGDWIAKRVHSVAEAVSHSDDRLIGYYQAAPGVADGALNLGGISSYVAHTIDSTWRLRGPFSIEAWIAVGAYPVNWCSIIAQAESNRGFSFGIDDHGRIGLRLFIDGKWIELVSKERVKLREWAHIVCSFDPQGQTRIFLNGQQVGELKVEGQFEPADGVNLLIGKEPEARNPTGVIRSQGTSAVHTYFDGLIDELKVYDRVLKPEEVAETYERLCPATAPALQMRRLPKGGGGPDRFGAYYTTLNYYNAWDAQWPVGERADVVVRFDENPSRFIFWRGTSYIPHWVSENNIWYNNQFNETWNKHGCQEPMSDKHCRHSQVQILENGQARVVVQWRYALVDNWYEFARVDPTTGFGEWTDETFTIYPDGVGVRQVTLRSMSPNAPHEWHEGIVVMGPGQRPEDVLQPEALTMINMTGEEYIYSWANGAPQYAEKPAGANIQIVNTKSDYRPFIAVPSAAHPNFDIYTGELRREVSMFPWWNHWPTAFDPSDGRHAMDVDRASHSSLTHCHWDAYESTPRSMTKIMLHGMTNKSPDEVLRLAKSWDSPPKLSSQSKAFSTPIYDPAQRAYVVRRSGDQEASGFQGRFDASQDSPLQNIALVIENWGSAIANVQINGQAAKFRGSVRHELEREDLILWIEIEAAEPVSIAVTAVN